MATAYIIPNNSDHNLKPNHKLLITFKKATKNKSTLHKSNNLNGGILYIRSLNEKSHYYLAFSNFSDLFILT